MGSSANRPQIPKPDPGDELGTLHLLYFRADYLRVLWGDAAEAARGAGFDMSLEGGHGLPTWVLCTLHLASLYTVLEGWRRLVLQDSDIDRLLKAGNYVDDLRALRNGVFHFGAINNPAILQVLGNRSMLSWAKDLHVAFGRFLTETSSHDAT